MAERGRHGGGTGQVRAWFVAALLVLALAESAEAQWIAQTKWVSLTGRLGTAYAIALLPPWPAADLVSVAIGHNLTDNFGLAVGTKLIEAGYPMWTCGGRGGSNIGFYRFSVVPFYIYGVFNAGRAEGWRHPSMMVFTGVGLSGPGSTDPLPYFRIGVRAEWQFGLLRPAAEFGWEDLGPTLGVSIGAGGWRGLGTEWSGEKRGMMLNRSSSREQGGE